MRTIVCNSSCRCACRASGSLRASKSVASSNLKSCHVPSAHWHTTPRDRVRRRRLQVVSSSPSSRTPKHLSIFTAEIRRLSPKNALTIGCQWASFGRRQRRVDSVDFFTFEDALAHRDFESRSADTLPVSLLHYRDGLLLFFKIVSI